jgi:hypothetical protein
MSQIDVSTFEGLMNKKFKVTRAAIAEENDGTATPPEDITLELVEVKEKKRDTHNTVSLLFHSVENTYLPQKTYSLSSDEFEPKDIFIVPIGEKKEGTGANAKKTGYVYQAIFSKLNES